MSEGFPTQTEDVVKNVIESLEEGEVSLDFIQQEFSEDYSRLIRAAEVVSFDDARAMRANYDEMWMRYGLEFLPGEKVPEVMSLFKEAIPDSIVCDLGSDGRMDLIAASHNADLFISVNKYPGGVKGDLLENPKVGYFNKVEFKDEITDTVLVPGTHNEISVQADLLDFASRLKDNSVNITINGIDSDLIDVEGYHEAVAKEIMRVTKKDGIIFGNSSVALYIIRNLIRTKPEISERFKSVYDNGRVVVIRKI